MTAIEEKEARCESLVGNQGKKVMGYILMHYGGTRAQYYRQAAQEYFSINDKPLIS